MSANAAGTAQSTRAAEVTALGALIARGLQYVNAWRGRTVYVVFDSDLTTNPSVKLAEFGLARELGRRGAKVLAVRLPGGPNGALPAGALMRRIATWSIPSLRAAFEITGSISMCDCVPPG